MTEHLRFNVRTIVRSLACMSAALIFGGIASATTFTTSCGTLSGPTELSGSLLCPTFNSLSGALTQIELDFSGSISGTATITNTSGGTATFTVTDSSVFNLGFLNGFLSGPLFTVSGTTAPTTLANGATSSPLSIASGTGIATLTDAATFAPYINDGVTTYSVPIFTLTGLSISGGGGNANVLNNLSGTIHADVTYTFDQATSTAPEPTTLGLIGGGLVGIGLISRRKRSTKTA